VGPTAASSDTSSDASSGTGAGPAPADLAIGAFSDNPPWIVDPDAMRWRHRAEVIRDTVRRQIPQMIRPRRIPPGMRVVTVVRHLGGAVAGWYLLDRRKGGSASTEGISRRLREAAEELGPTFIKLGQIISSGEGIFPGPLVEEFKKCRDQVPAEPFTVVRRVIEEELGRPIETVFAEIDERPLAAASIAQVHRARLLDGTEVVVKVQRPTVAEFVHRDLAVLSWIAPFLIGRIPVASLANPPALVELFAETVAEELDFRLEAENMLDVARVLVELGQRGYVIPRPHPELVTRRILVMERLDGFRFDDVAGITDAGIDTHAIVRTGMIAFMEGCLIHGVFHGDLHGGNLFVMADGRTALLDFGITGRLNQKQRHAFLRLVIGATMNDVRGQLAALCDLGALPHDTDLDEVIRELGLDGPPIDPTKLTQDELVAELQRIMKALLAFGARLPKELMLYGKNMVFLDGAIATLAPDLDLFAEIAHLATYFATTHGQRLAEEIGMDPNAYTVDLTGVKGTFGVEAEVERFTYRELQERRELIKRRLGGG
jgi:ubiquinone biosynthesis protein